MRRACAAKRRESLVFFAGLSLLFLLPFFPSVNAAEAEQGTGQEKVTLYFFWGDGCPHCAEEEKFLADLKSRHLPLRIVSFEVWHSPANARFLARMLEKFGVKSSGVPVTFVDTKVFVGFSKETARGIEDALAQCLERPCIDPIDRGQDAAAPEVQEKISIPLIGEIDPTRLSLPVLTLVLGGLDSFNPCAFFVLLFLLSLLIHARSRGRMLLIGGTFVFFSGLIYFLFMAAWLNLFLIAGRLMVITTVAGIVALFVAALNIKDFFLFGKGVSLVIPEKAKPMLYERMRDLLKSSSTLSALSGTVVLAIVANTYELLCTAGFPMVFTRALTLHDLPGSQYYLYLIAYNVVYVIPLLLIVMAMTATLGARKLTEWQGRQLKLISGMMMLLMGGILVIRPALLNSALTAVLLLAAALSLSAVIILVARRVRPQIVVR